MHRRQWLMRTACGFGGLASGAMLTRAAAAGQQPHFAPKAKRIIFLFMQGGVSHVDSFDYKPLLAERDGEMLSLCGRPGLGQDWPAFVDAPRDEITLGV